MTRLTIKDIARLSGVGKSTVSRVLNQDPKVSDKTRAKVEKIIAEQGFLPSNSARAMRGQGNRVIGIIVSRLTSSAENQVLSAMLPLLYAAHCEPIIVESRFDEKLVQDHLTLFRQKAVDGVILFSFSSIEQLDLSSWKQKLVVIARNHPRLTSIYYDDHSAVQQLMQTLLQKSHQAIAYIGVDDNDTTTGFLRHHAYLSFCRQHQLPMLALQGDLNFESGYQLAQQIDFSQYSALVCATNNLALGAIKYLQQQQLTHIYVASVGNNPLLSFLFPQTLMIDLGFQQAGEKAVSQLLYLLDGGQEIKSICLPCHLLEN
ncbi:trehalose operon repressor TreR [Gallibacterium anatis]|uniref:trehalose operon repressor TreR n=1 Tax=Gallibacterium anatis TaxID=750 RepID=UPI000531215E|nr:trehalose operon repressor TreR [Gallibacterium anatis]KGQ64303.1 trehalose repressor [Gallibacterium anatis]